MLGKGQHFYQNYLKSLSMKNALCQIWLILEIVPLGLKKPSMYFRYVAIISPSKNRRSAPSPFTLGCFVSSLSQFDP